MATYTAKLTDSSVKPTDTSVAKSFTKAVLAQIDGKDCEVDKNEVVVIPAVAEVKDEAGTVITAAVPEATKYQTRVKVSYNLVTGVDADGKDVVGATVVRSKVIDDTPRKTKASTIAQSEIDGAVEELKTNITEEYVV